MPMDLPSILSGPIVRRVEPTQVYIWIATSEAYQIEAELYEISSKNDNVHHYERVPIHNETESIALGKRLYIHLIRVTPQANHFPTNMLIGYNLLFTRDDVLFDLNSFGLLSSQNPHSIIYSNLKYPTFFINTSENNNLLYASCRKLHGKGEDALASADQTLEENAINVEKRPSALFLMGDQIYADDVADPIIPFISKLGKQLIGNEEPLEKVDERLGLQTFIDALEKIHGRQFIMDHFANFTSNHAQNHLIEFGEFAAMYLLSFSPDIWELAEANGLFDEIPDVDENYYYIYPKGEKKHTKERNQHLSRFEEQMERLHSFRLTTASIRRVLANASTYMIFDDHDITDDWNLTHDWKRRVHNSSLGKHVIANGLTAYWAFQGWGNDPDAFDNRFKLVTTEYFQTLQVESSSYQQWTDQFLGFDSWFFIAPTTPSAVFLDTRTMRSYDPLPRPTSIGAMIEENVRSPQLISEEGWERISNRLMHSGWRKENRLMIISPTPLYGIGLIESFLDRYIYPLRTTGIPVQQMIDFEAWKYNDEGFNQFIAKLAEWQPSDCCILSGDVHYGASVRTRILFNEEANQELELYQFTSSPAKNESFYGLWGYLMKRIIKINARRRKRGPIYRYCDEDSNLYIHRYEVNDTTPHKWKEVIRYLPMDNGSIIAIDNNIGLVSITPEAIENKLIHYYGLYCERREFPPIS